MNNGGTNTQDTLNFAQKKNHKLTRKQKAVADYILKHPTAPAKEAAQKVSPHLTEGSAEWYGSETLRNPKVIQYMQNHAHRAEQVLVEAMEASKPIYEKDENGKWEKVDDAPEHLIRIKAADSLLDRVYGKATQKIQQSTSVTTIQIDLTGGKAEPIPQAILDQLGA